MIIEVPRKSSRGKILTIMVLCSSFEEAKNYKLPLKYNWGYELVDGVLESYPHNKSFPYYRVIQRNLIKPLINLQ
jgi:hypothetical protein